MDPRGWLFRQQPPHAPPGRDPRATDPVRRWPGRASRHRVHASPKLVAVTHQVTPVVVPTPLPARYHVPPSRSPRPSPPLRRRCFSTGPAWPRPPPPPPLPAAGPSPCRRPRRLASRASSAPRSTERAVASSAAQRPRAFRTAWWCRPGHPRRSPRCSRRWSPGGPSPTGPIRPAHPARRRCSPSRRPQPSRPSPPPRMAGTSSARVPTASATRRTAAPRQAEAEGGRPAAAAARC